MNPLKPLISASGSVRSNRTPESLIYIEHDADQRQDGGKDKACPHSVDCNKNGSHDWQANVQKTVLNTCDAGCHADMINQHIIDNSGHSHKSGQNNRTDDISADLKTVADIVAEFVPVAVDHLFKIEDYNRQKRIDRDKMVILKCFHLS